MVPITHTNHSQLTPSDQNPPLPQPPDKINQPPRAKTNHLNHNHQSQTTTHQNQINPNCKESRAEKWVEHEKERGKKEKIIKKERGPTSE